MNNMSVAFPVLEVGRDAEAVLVARPNRFLAIADIPSARMKNEPVHVHDPGRLEDILYPGNRLLLRRAANPGRKTAWDVIAGYAGGRWVLINSAFHRSIAERVLSDPAISPVGKADVLYAEKQLGSSRIDFLLEQGGTRLWIEVKGCTLSEEGKALFPDAPTARGTRHLEELGHAVESGDRAALLVLIFREEARCFYANGKIDPAFYRAFRDTLEKGVQVHPLVFGFRDGIICYRGCIPLCPERIKNG
jgi:sugar fermentation stimulation protein A